MGEDHLLGVHFLPVRPAILRAINRTGFIAGIDDVGIVRMERQRPGICPLLGGFQSLPVLSPIVTTIRPSIRAGIQNGWVMGMHEQRSHLWVRWQSFAETLP